MKKMISLSPRRLMAALAAIFICGGMAARATTLTGTFKNPDGSLFSGTVFFTLSSSTTISTITLGSGYVCPGPLLIPNTYQVPVVVSLGVITGSPNLYDSECTQPAGIPYSVLMVSLTGQQVRQLWVITGVTEDVGTIVPVTTSGLIFNVPLYSGGAPGPAGPAGPNTVSGSTGTGFNGVLGGNAAYVYQMSPAQIAAALSATPSPVTVSTLTATTSVTTPLLNNTVSSCSFPGSTFDAKIANAFASLPSSLGTVDATCLGTTSNTAAAPISLLNGQILKFSPATKLIPASASSNVVNMAIGSEVDGLHVDLTTYAATYTGSIVHQACETGGPNSGITIKNERITGANGASGSALSLACSTASWGIAYDQIQGLYSFGLLNPIQLSTGAAGAWINSNTFSGLTLIASSGTPFTGISLVNSGAEIRANEFYFSIEGNSLTASTGVSLTGGGSSYVQANRFYGNMSDVTNSWTNSGTNIAKNLYVGNADVAPADNGLNNINDLLHNVNQFYNNVTASGGNAALIANDTATAQAALVLRENGVTKWQLGKDADNSLFLYDQTNALDALLVSPVGNTALGETGKAVTLVGAVNATISIATPQLFGTVDTLSGATPAINAAHRDFVITLSANATATVSGLAAGEDINAQICQPATGGPYTWTWPSAFHGGLTIGTTASDCSEQTFHSFNGTTAVALSTGAINVAP